jgi:hypothetical protein
MKLVDWAGIFKADYGVNSVTEEQLALYKTGWDPALAPLFEGNMSLYYLQTLSTSVFFSIKYCKIS